MDLLLPSTSAPRIHCTSASHAALKSSPLWKLLPLQGKQPTYEEDEAQPQYLEGKNCPNCHSTLYVAVSVQEAA